MGGDEVLQNVEPFTEVGADRNLDGFTRCVCHQTAHTSQLTDLVDVTSGSRLGHHIHRIKAIQRIYQGILDLLGGLAPGRDNGTLPLFPVVKTVSVVSLDFLDLLVGLFKIALLDLRNYHVGNTDGDGTLSGILESQGLDLIQNDSRFIGSVDLDAAIDYPAQFLFPCDEIHFIIKHGLRIGSVHKSKILGNGTVKYDFPHCGIYHPGLLDTVHHHGPLDPDSGMKAYNSVLIGHQCLLRRRKCLALSNNTIGYISVLVLLRLFLDGQVIGSQHHILGRNGYWFSILRLQQVIGRQHQEPGFSLGFS